MSSREEAIRKLAEATVAAVDAGVNWPTVEDTVSLAYDKAFALARKAASEKRSKG